MNFHALLERIKNKGYTPVLAHPERYLYMEKRDYEKRKLMGIKFQRNAFSIDGQYGKKVQKRCKWLMKPVSYTHLLGSVQNERHILEFLVLVELLDVAQHAALHQAAANHEDCLLYTSDPQYVKFRYSSEIMERIGGSPALSRNMSHQNLRCV